MADTLMIDFTNVKEGGGFNKKRVPAGDYAAKIVKAELGEVKSGDNAGTPQFVFTIKLQHPRYGSGAYPYRCQVKENQLWKLRNLLVAAGKAVPKSKIKVDPSVVVGKTVGVTMEDDEYNGNEQSEVAAIFPASELSDSVAEESGDDEAGAEDEPEEDQAEVADGEEEEPEVESDPLASLDRAALKAEIKVYDEGAQFRKSETDDDLRDRLRALQQQPAQTVDDELEELDIDEV